MGATEAAASGLDVIPLSAVPEEAEAEAEDVIPLPEATGPFLLNAATREPDLRLGEELADWPRYLTLGIQTEIADLSDPTIKYPSVEAAIAAAKYQKATDKAELGASLFRVEGAIHQKFEKEREKLRSTGAPAEALALLKAMPKSQIPPPELRNLIEALEKSVDDEVGLVRVSSGVNKMKSYKATWNKDAWETQRDGIYKAYMAQRFATDARFRAMVEAIKAKGGEILFVNGVEPSYLGVGVRIDGSIAGGENMIGKWMMALA